MNLNADLGEGSGADEAILACVDSANIACGAHAGSMSISIATAWRCRELGVEVGAHPGFEDRAGFGRVDAGLSAREIEALVSFQVAGLAAVAPIAYIKPHGALYNQAVHNRELAQAIADGVVRWRRDVVLVGLAGSPMLDVFRSTGFPVAAEAFADRRYEADATLRSRKHDDALIRDPVEASRQALSIAQQSTVTARDGTRVAIAAQTICIHGDTPGAPQIAAAVAKTLREAGVTLSPLSP